MDFVITSKEAHDYVVKRQDAFIQYKKQGTYTCHFTGIDKNGFRFTYVRKDKQYYLVEYKLYSHEECVRFRFVRFDKDDWQLAFNFEEIRFKLGEVKNIKRILIAIDNKIDEINGGKNDN